MSFSRMETSPQQQRSMTPPAAQDEIECLDDDDFMKNNNGESKEQQDILMKLSFSVKKKDGTNVEECAEILQSYVASFPFAAVLPVQPLTYTPRRGRETNNDDSNDRYPGVSVVFLRKKTKEKEAIDGGIEFLISVQNSSQGQQGTNVIQLLAIRNTKGQTVSKVFSEGLIIKSFVSGLIGEDDDYNDGGRVGLGKDILLQCLSIDSCIHKWM